MADNTINIDLKVHNNIKSSTTDAEGLNTELSAATRNLIAYNKAAAIGGTSARDFSKEAEGLGGIVRSYAIIAANIYAVSSAFKVLSDAMDTTIMVRSMDILGARSGIALGSLAKELVKVSDGALSLRESMEVVTKGTTAGMTSAQLRDLTKVAGNASRALGLNMPDAMSRLIRGTSKLEPELLDELGLFTKLEPAVNEYARSLGKSASSLTDFEKRQAFLIATIKEGKDKYNELEEAGTNAYTRLGAALKDNLQSVLEKVNTFLVPIIDFLSKSPTALYGVLLGIGTLLLKQIVPALSQFNASLEKSVNAASIEAVGRFNRVQKAVTDRAAAAKTAAIAASEAEADAKVAAIDKVEKKLKSLQRRGGALTPGIQEIVSQTTPATDISAEKARELRSELRQSGLSRQDRRVQYEYIKSLEQSRDAENTLAAAVRGREQAIIDAQKTSRTFKDEQTVMNRAIQKSAQQLNLINVAETTRNLGVLEGFRAGMQDIAARRAGPTTREIPTGEKDKKTGEDITKTVNVQKLGAVAGGIERVKVAAVAATQAASSFLAAFSPWLAVIGLLAPALGVLHDKLVGNVNDIEATNDAYEKLEGGVKSAYKTIEFLGKNSEKVLSVENLTAASNALANIGTDLEDFTRKAQRELTTGKESPWYKFVEGAQKLVGFGTEKSISKALLSSFDAAVQLSIADSEPVRKELAKVLQLPEDATFASIRLKAADADADTQMKFAQALKQIGINAQAAVQPTKDLLDAFTQTGKVFDNIITSVLPSTGLAKWAYDGVQNMQTFRKEVGNVATDIGTLNDIVKVPGDLIKKFGIEGSAAIIPLIPRIKELNKSYTETVNKLGDLDKAELGRIDQTIARQKQAVDMAKLQLSVGPKDNTQNQKALKAAEDQLANSMKIREDTIDKSTARKSLLGTKTQQEDSIRSLFAEFDKISAQSAIEFAKLFEVELGNAAAKASLSISKTITGYIQDPGAKAKLELINTKEEIGIQRQQIEATINLIKAMEGNKIEVARLTNSMAQKTIREDEKLSKSEKEKALAPLLVEQRSLELRREALATGTTAKIEQSRNLRARGEAGLAEERAATQAIGPATSLNLQLKAAGAKSAELDAAEKSAEIRAKVEGGINSIYSKRQTVLDRELESLQTNRKETELSAVGEIDKLEKINAIDAQILEKQQQKKIQEAERLLVLAETMEYELRNDKKRSALAKENTAAAQSNLEAIKNQSTEAARLAQIEKSRQEAVARISEKYNKIYETQKNSNIILEATRKLEDAVTEGVTSKFEAEVSLGKYTAQQIQDKRAEIALNKINTDELRQQEDARKNLLSTQTKLGDELEKASLPGYTGTRTAQQIRDQIQIESDAYNIVFDSITKSNEAKRESLRLTNSMSVQEKGFADIFTKGFESMADAMAEFVKTGKLDFKSLINSMIMDLIRFQLRSQMQSLAGPGGGANFLAAITSRLFGGSSSSPYDVTAGNTGLFGGADIGGVGAAPYAKGGAFNNGIEKFAMGAAFTNSIVNSPTLFKFAQGTGLMGEAGPEAIMPLKRDATGTLGVRSSQPKVDIVVNNYSGQKTETKETTDARGNRKIEVVVGEMSASDISKPGSSSQQALRSNYGLQPALIRR